MFYEEQNEEEPVKIRIGKKWIMSIADIGYEDAFELLNNIEIPAMEETQQWML